MNSLLHLLKKYSVFLCLFFLCDTSLTIYAGFDVNTLVKVPDSFVAIKDLVVDDYVESGYFESFVVDFGQFVINRVIYCSNSFEKKVVHLTLDGECIITSLDQKFYLPLEKCWRCAKSLKPGDFLLSASNEYVSIVSVDEIEKEIELFDITVENSHTFFVSRHAILVHNIVPVAIGLSFAFGGGIELTGISFGCGILGWLGFKFFKNKQHAYDTNYQIGDYAIELHNSAEKGNKARESNDGGGAQAPGKPTEKDGYVPPKNWDGEKVRHKKSGQHGWPDKDGNIWIPSGPKGHGGAHWDVQWSKGGYSNVLPGGKIRGQK